MGVRWLIRRNLAYCCRSVNASFRRFVSGLFLSMRASNFGVSAKSLGSALTDDSEDITSTSSFSKSWEMSIIPKLTLVLCFPREGVPPVMEGTLMRKGLVAVSWKRMGISARGLRVGKKLEKSHFKT